MDTLERQALTEKLKNLPSGRMAKPAARAKAAPVRSAKPASTAGRFAHIGR